MSTNNTELTFRIFKGDTLVREETLATPVIKIGKLSSSHLRLEDDSVSRMHAVIEASSSGVSIIDLGSTTGTRVNGQRINKATLSDGDTIVIGELRLEVAVGAQEHAQSVSIAPVEAPPPVPSVPALAPVPALAQRTGSDEWGPDVAAVEVTAMLGDSVVDVKHVMNPRGGKVTRITYGLFGAGAVLLLASCIAFLSGVGTAADNKARYHEHISANKAAHEFRPRRLSSTFDWMALGGLAGGLVCMTAGLLRIREERIRPNYRIGSAPGVDLPTENAPQDDFSLVAPDGDSFVLNFAESWEGQISQAGQTTSLSELASIGGAKRSPLIPGAWQMAIPANANIRIHTGSQNFSVRAVSKPKTQATPLWAGGNTDLFAYLGATAIVVLGFVFLLSGLQPDEDTLAGDAFSSSMRMAHLQTTPQEDPIEEPTETETGSDEEAGGTGTAMAGESGKMGDKDEKRQSGQFATKKTSELAPALARELAREQAKDAGILGIMRRQQGGAFAAITGTADFSNGIDDRDVYGDLTGSEVAAAAGGWGYGVDGVGPGANGTGWGTIGTGNYGLIGHSEGTGTGYKPGTGKGDLRQHKAAPPTLKIGDPTKNGDLDAKTIRRYVRKKLARIRHCYEKELLASPTLSGTVNTRFQISPAGKVQGVKASGLGNSDVEGCVAEAISSIQFPTPKNGGYVNVTNYPFTFQPAG